MTTVGYGDITPKTTEGKIVAMGVMLIGIGIATLVIGAVAQRFVATSISPQLTEVEAEEHDLLAQVRDIADRLQRVQEALEQQQHQKPDRI